MQHFSFIIDGKSLKAYNFIEYGNIVKEMTFLMMVYAIHKIQ